MMTGNDVSGIVVDCCVKVHSTLEPGLFESVYEEDLAYELLKRGLTAKRQVEIPVVYETVKMNIGFHADIVVENQLIVELKSVEAFQPVHRKQLLTYLKDYRFLSSASSSISMSI